MRFQERPPLAQRNHSELSHMAGAVDDSTINIVLVIFIIIIIIIIVFSCSGLLSCIELCIFCVVSLV